MGDWDLPSYRWVWLEKYTGLIFDDGTVKILLPRFHLSWSRKMDLFGDGYKSDGRLGDGTTGNTTTSLQKIIESGVLRVEIQVGTTWSD